MVFNRLLLVMICKLLSVNVFVLLDVVFILSYGLVVLLVNFLCCIFGINIFCFMVPKSKIMRLYTLQIRLDSIIRDFKNIPNITDDILFELETVAVSLNNAIDYVRAKG